MPPSPTSTETATASSTRTATPDGTATPYFYLTQNAWNPETQTIEAKYALAAPGDMVLLIYNSAGELIRTLTEKNVPAHVDRTLPWDGANETGKPCVAGIYIFRVRIPGVPLSHKACLLR